MKRYLQILVAVVVAIAVATPALAAVEWKFGGQFRARYLWQDNLIDANDEADDTNTYVDQRLRMYFTAKASENLKVVVRFEMGDTVWGQSRNTFVTGFVTDANGNKLPIETSISGQGGRMGADQTIVELKNAYVEFNIPQTTATAIVGIQGINLLNSWIADDDFSAAVVKAKFEPVVVSAGYIGGQNNPDMVVTKGIVLGSATPTGSWSKYGLHTEDRERIDAYFMSVDYANGPWSASLIGMYSDSRSTVNGLFPMNQVTPVPGGGVSFFPDNIRDNNIFDIGVNVGYKIDWLSAYVSFVKNLGSVDLRPGSSTIGFGNWESHDYTGWMVDAGVTYFCGPYTLNLGGFYTSGQEFEESNPYTNHDDINWFTYPVTTSKYFSEIIGGGILDNLGGGGFGSGWNGYQFPTNLWTVTVGGSWQALEKTKLSLSYWYFGTAEDVAGSKSEGTWINGAFYLGPEVELANDIGHEIDFYVTQGIVDGLTLDLVAAVLIPGDAYTGPFVNRGVGYSEFDPDTVYELGARLQWNF